MSKKGDRFQRRLEERRVRAAAESHGRHCAFCGAPGAEVEWEGAGLVCRDVMACEGRALDTRAHMKARRELPPEVKASYGPAACPVCGSVGARALMLDHIEAEHPGRLIQVTAIRAALDGEPENKSAGDAAWERVHAETGDIDAANAAAIDAEREGA